MIDDNAGLAVILLVFCLNKNLKGLIDYQNSLFATEELMVSAIIPMNCKS